jgi:hypothetical protein
MADAFDRAKKESIQNLKRNIECLELITFDKFKKTYGKGWKKDEKN